jgi:hypothetical protein
MSIPIGQSVQALINSNAIRIEKSLRNKQGPGLGQISEISPNIFISGAQTAQNVAVLAEMKIGSVYAIKVPKTPKLEEQYKMHRINGLHVQEYKFEQAYNFMFKCIMNQKKGVLVVCPDGLMYSVAIVAFYFLCRYYQWRSKCIRVEEMSDNKDSGSDYVDKRNDDDDDSDSDDEITPELKAYMADKKMSADIAATINKKLVVERILDMIQNGRPCIAPNVAIIRELIKIEFDMNIKLLENEKLAIARAKNEKIARLTTIREARELAENKRRAHELTQQKDIAHRKIVEDKKIADQAAELAKLVAEDDDEFESDEDIDYDQLAHDEDRITKEAVSLKKDINKKDNTEESETIDNLDDESDYLN